MPGGERGRDRGAGLGEAVGAKRGQLRLSWCTPMLIFFVETSGRFINIEVMMVVPHLLKHTGPRVCPSRQPG